MSAFRTKSIFHLLVFCAVLASLLGGAVFVTPAYASTLTVTKTADTNDGTCDSDCSLREAIAAAGAGDTITFASGLSGGTIYLASTLTLSQNVTIDGSALATKITLSGDSDNNGTGDVRVLWVNSGVTASLNSLVITKGILTVSDSGAGIYNDGTLTIANSTLSNNASTCSGCYAGGIYSSNGSTLTITNSTLSGNSAGVGGGGIFNAAATVTVTGSTFSGNSGVSGGGGIYNSGGTTTVTGSTFSGNSTSTGAGGGIYSGGPSATLTVTDSTFSGNSAFGGGGGIGNGSTLTVTNSTFSGNTTSGSGAGIQNAFATATIVNSTFSGNSSNSGGGLSNLGSSAIVTITNSTFSGNAGSSFAGGLYNFDGTLNYTNTIVANSTAGGDCVNTGTLGTNDTNLVEDGSCSAALTGDPNLGALASNGGPTKTLALQSGSIAINTGNDTVCAASPVSSLDQRGNTRPSGPHCDIGAYEATSPDTVPPSVTSFTATSPSPSLAIPITAFSASDNVGVTGYIVTQSSTPPGTGDSGWTASAPSTYSVGSNGPYTLYPWVRDAVGYVSALYGSPASVTVCAPTTVTVLNANDSGAGSLRQALTDACPNSTINFDSSLSGGTIYLASTLTLSKNVTIDGSSLASQLIISGDTDNNTVGDVRVLWVNSGVTASLDSLVITKGRVVSETGGGIVNQGTLTITNGTVSNSSAAGIGFNSGGILNDTGGTLTITGSTLSGNSSGTAGGALYNVSGGTVTITNSTLSGNSTSAFGGGIFNDGTLTVTGSTLSGNSSGNAGGAIFSDATLTITNSTFSSNTATLNGAGIYSQGGTLTITGSTFSSNTATSGSGAGIFNTGTVTLTTSTFSGNSAASGSGGGVSNQSGGTLTVSNSTFSGNSSTNGGGISNPTGGTLMITNSTLSGNSGAGFGGGIFNAGTLDYANTIIANSPAGGDCDTASGSLGINTNNLVEDGSCSASLSGDPNLGALANNGGPTQTFALYFPSPAIDAGDTTLCASLANNLDQRGIARPQAAKCDIGAYEKQPFVVTKAADTNDGTCDADCSLREAITAANAQSGGDLITFDNDYTITLGSDLPYVSDNLSIDGGTHTVVIDGNSHHPFDINLGVTAALSQLTVQNAYRYTDGGAVLNRGTLSVADSTFIGNVTSTSGGALDNYLGTLSVTDSTFTSNTSTGGGAIKNDAGVLTINGSTFESNIGDDGSGGGNGGAVLNTGTATISNSTFHANSVGFSGGAVYNSVGTLTLVNSTFSDNSAGGGGAGLINNGTLNYANTIIANSTAGGDCVNTGTLGTNTHNLVEDGSCSASLSGDPLLGIAAYNGGPTKTMALETGSIAIDAGDDSACAAAPVNNLDQRGMLRPNGPHCDIGAYERYIIPLPISPGNGEQLLNNHLTVFDWTDAVGATKYSIQVSKNNTFSLLLINKTAASSVFVSPSDLPAGLTLYWRVRKVAPVVGAYSPVFSFTTARPPSTPALVLPANNSLTSDYTPRLDWSTVTLPVGTSFQKYEVQLSQGDASFSAPLYAYASGAVTNSEYTFSANLGPNIKYYWRVRAYNTLGQYGNWSVVRYFRTSLPVPDLSAGASPVGGTNTHTNRPFFDWSDVSGASGYTIQISRNSTFTKLVVTGLRVGGANSDYTPLVDLPRATPLYWRVMANGLNPSVFSAVESFVTGNSPSTPMLIGPMNNFLTPSNTLTLKWKPVVLGTLPPKTFGHFEVQLADNAAFSAPLVDDTSVTSDLPANTLLVVSPALVPNTTYYWRVRAFETGGDYSGWSTVWTIRTHIAAPTLLSPIGGASSGGLRPLFDWSDAAGATGYIIQVSKNSSFTLLVLNKTFLGGSSYTPALNLPTGLTLYWRVLAIGPNGPSAYSTTESFVTP